ncbi:MAG: hypothetical protein GY928_33660 [Colwellia sp.]|nr:hypothetical protein [Colwellia sp.]
MIAITSDGARIDTNDSESSDPDGAMIFKLGMCIFIHANNGKRLCWEINTITGSNIPMEILEFIGMHDSWREHKLESDLGLFSALKSNCWYDVVISFIYSDDEGNVSCDGEWDFHKLEKYTPADMELSLDGPDKPIEMF